jgi:hypothetical protein
MPLRQRRLGRAAAVACAGAATMTITMAVPAAAASGRAEYPGIDLQDPLSSVKCPVDEVTRRILPSQPATSLPTKAPAPVRTSAPAAQESGDDRPTRTTQRSATAAHAPADESARGGAGNGGSPTWFVPPIPDSMQLPAAVPSYPYVEPSYPYPEPEVAGDPSRGSIQAASAESTDARTRWAMVALALVILLCAMHLRVATQRLRREADHSVS